MMITRCGFHAARSKPMPTFAILGSLTQEGFDNLENGPDTVTEYVDQVNAMGGEFSDDNFYVLSGEYDWMAIVELPSQEAASQMAMSYARGGRGRMQVERVVAQGAEGYREHISDIV